MSPLIYDLEIIKAIPDKKSPPQPGIEYCEGWHDHTNMGISVLCAYDYAEERYRVFCEDNKQQFIDLVRQRLPVTFNGVGFDDKVLTACWNYNPSAHQEHYDILQETWVADGLAPTFQFPSHIGYGLDAICQATFPNVAKTGSGALAPVDWQENRYGAVIDYCLNDVKMTKVLFDTICRSEPLNHPKQAGKILQLRLPPNL